MDQLNDWTNALLALYAALATIAALTPTDKDDKILGRVKNIVDIIKRIRR